MTRWLIPIAVTALVALALLAFPDEVGAVDDEEAPTLEQIGCGDVHEVAVAVPDVYRSDRPATDDSSVDARTEPQQPGQPTITLIAETAPEAGVPWVWFALAGLVGAIGVAGLAYAARPALSHHD
jgi:hypothetical protein